MEHKERKERGSQEEHKSLVTLIHYALTKTIFMVHFIILASRLGLLDEIYRLPQG
jgi:hypothetical protein